MILVFIFFKNVIYRDSFEIYLYLWEMIEKKIVFVLNGNYYVLYLIEYNSG